MENNAVPKREPTTHSHSHSHLHSFLNIGEEMKKQEDFYELFCKLMKENRNDTERCIKIICGMYNATGLPLNKTRLLQTFTTILYQVKGHYNIKEIAIPELLDIIEKSTEVVNEQISEAIRNSNKYKRKR